MSYIGSTPVTQTFISGTDYFNGDGTTTAFTLSRRVNSVNDVEAVINNVEQQPNTAYNISGNTITFTSAPSAGTGNIYVRYLTTTSQTMALGPNTVTQGPQYISINNATALGGATNPILGTSGSANNYVQTYVQNLTNGANSSADFTAYPSNGTDAAGWVDMGMTGPTFSQATYSVTGPNEAYLFGSGVSGSGTGNLVIATDATGSANAIQFYTGGFTKAKSAAAMQIDSNSNIGVGTTSVGTATKLQVNGRAIFTGGASDPADGSPAGVVLGYNTGSSYGFIQSIQTGVATKDLYIQPTGTNNVIINPSGGAVVIGNTSAGNQNANNLNYVPSSGQGYVGHVNGTGSGTAYWIFAYNGIGIGSITQNGTTAVSYNTSSDYRLKENVAPMTGALSKVAQLKPVTYTWKADGSASDGFIAHELAEVCPQAVHGQKDAVDAEGKPVYQGIDTSFLVATLTAAIQEQQAIITSLQSRIAALEAK